MKTIIISIGLTFLLASCAVQKSTTVKTMDVIGGGIIQTPVIVDLDVKPTKVTGTSNGKSDVPLENVKQAAVADAVKNANADVLVEPRFETSLTSSNKTVVVTGYPATYKNFRQMTDADTTLVMVSSMYKATVYEPTTVQKQKGSGKTAKSIGKIYLFSAIGVAILALIAGS